jgi:thiol-disulfide isomerase/thioredoxin
MAKIASTRWRAGMAVGLAFIIGVAVFLIVLELLRRWGGQYEPLDPPSRRMASVVEYPQLAPNTGEAGPIWRLQDQAGKVVLVNYFATWCGPCMEELPELRALAMEYMPRGVVFVAVSLDAPEDRLPPEPVEPMLRQFARERNFPLTILVPAADSMLMHTRPMIPQTFVYDRHARRARMILGGIGGRNVKASLEELLQEQ